MKKYLPFVFPNLLLNFNLRYPSSNSIKGKSLVNIFFICTLTFSAVFIGSLLPGNRVLGQAQTIGVFPGMEGGFENVATAQQAATTVATGTQLTAYTGANVANSIP